MVEIAASGQMPVKDILTKPIEEMPPTRNAIGSPSPFLDLALISKYISRIDPSALSKSGIAARLEGKVGRPPSKTIRIPEDPDERLRQKEATAKVIEEMLDQNKRVYLKSEAGHSGKGLIVISSTPNTLVLTIPDDNTRRIVCDGYDRLEKTPGEAPIIYMGGSMLSRDVTIATNKPGMIQPRDEILRGLVGYGLLPEEYLVEGAIDIPLHYGHTWEVRNIFQSPEGAPKLQAMFAKVGADESFSNMSLGGASEDPRIVLRGVFGEKGLTGEERDEAVEAYLERNNKTAEIAARTLKEYMRELAAKHISGMSPDEFYPWEFTVDITGQFDEAGMLQPVVGEMQYPLNPPYSYIPQLQKTDPAALEKVQETHEALEKADAITMAKLTA